ncbi:hypothetical protein BFP78_00100 [Gaetbulibacter sp. 5U11]|nr:hypothetical protein BFP78_00100 [Gaetbulibacter sp. 5U11]
MKQIWLLLLLSISFTLSAQDDTTLSQVNSRNGYIYKNNALFTGILYSDESANNECKCTLEASYSQGKLNGVKKEWYPNGNIKFIGNFKDGKIIGNSKRYNKNGVLLNDIKSLTKEQMLLFTLKAFPPDSYTDEFLRKYLYEFDSNYENYRKNEFELNRKKQSIKEDIKKRVSTVKYDETYTVTGNVTISKYSFQNQSFALSNSYNGFFLTYASDDYYIFSRTSMKSNNKNISNSYLRAEPVNKNDFLSFTITPNKAENLKNKLSSKLIYYSYNFKILPLNSKEVLANKNNRFGSPGIPAFITKMNLYSDKNRQNLIYTIYPNKNYDEVLGSLRMSKNIDIENNKAKQTRVNNISNNSVSNTTNRQIKSDSNQSLNEQLLNKAEGGDKYSQNELALNYFEGKKTTKDLAKAKFWFKKAAENGYAISQENLAAIYFEEKDFNNAFIWYTRAANSNHSRAQYVLGFMHRKGLGTKKSRKKAKSWWKKSCQLGYKESCEEIKKMNALGNAILNSVNESIKKQ